MHSTMQGQKTIFITSFYGLIGRNLLATGILKVIKQSLPETRIVILLPKEKQEMYQKLFGSENVIVEGVPGAKESKLEELFGSAFFFLSGTESAKIAYWVLSEQRKYPQVFIFWLLSKLGKIRLVRHMARLVDYWAMPKNRYQKYFEKYRPDMVFATDIFRYQDIDVMREARARGIFTVGMVRSWDNVSTKGLSRSVPDKVIVQAEKMKEDIIKYGDINPKNIAVVGVPHYDRYLTGERMPRDTFFKSLSLDPKKKTVIISPPLRHYTQDPIPEVIFNALAPLEDVQVIVRLTLVGKSNIGSLKPIPGKLAIDAPETAEDFNRADITTGDEHLADLLYHSDAIISHLSTLAIDGIVFDKPAFFAGFNTKSTPYHQGVRWFFDMDCARDLIATGAVKLSNSVEELMKQLLPHLQDPNLSKAERRLVQERYCYKLDGKSGERLGEVIVGTLLNLK